MASGKEKKRMWAARIKQSKEISWSMGRVT